MVLQLEQIPEGAVAINDGEENREASETGRPDIYFYHLNLYLIF